MNDGFSIECDEDSGLVTITGRGFWTAEDIIAHFRSLQPIVEQVRARHGRVHALVDLRTAPVQSADTSDVVHKETQRIYREIDRIAIVRTSHLLDLQMKRAVDGGQLQTFATLEEALAWLRS